MNLRTAALLLATATSAVAVAKTPAPPPVAAEPARAHGLVFALTTGPEDMMRMSSPFRQARMVMEQHASDRATIVISGRAAVLLLPGYTMPAELKTEFEAAKAAGVRIVACEHSLGRFGIPVEHARTLVEVVPAAILEIARLVGEGDEVLNY